MTIFFTADTHFGDHRTINIQKRPFASVGEMDAVLIERWNAMVGPDDIVWHLGDVARRAADVPALLDRLHSYKTTHKTQDEVRAVCCLSVDEAQL